MGPWNRQSSIADAAGITATAPPCYYDLWQDAHRELLQYSQWTRLPFFCVDAETGVVLSRADDRVIPVLPDVVHARLLHACALEVVELNAEIAFCLFPMTPIDERPVVGVGYASLARDTCPDALSLAAAEYGLADERVDAWWRQIPVIDCDLMHDLMQNIIDRMQLLQRVYQMEKESVQLTLQLERNHEEIDILHTLTQNLQISRSPAEMARLCLKRMNGVIRAECTAIWLADHHDKAVFYFDGDLLLGEIDLARLISHFDSHDWSRPVIQNNVKGTAFEHQFPQLRNFIIVPVAEGKHRFGWIISCNLHESSCFSNVESSLLKSVAIILGTHVRNIDLYAKHDELLVSFVKSLVSTLDAKDPYTRGHSERVALVARCLGEELGLPQTDLEDIYLSGVLHDIGKIGVDDRILRKDDALTPEEFAHIQQHPVIGYNILLGLKNLHRILPGVRNHHENFNGQGYPDKLKGREISLMARILAVADSFDAMGSDRPYRKGMPLDQIETIFRERAGEQWDAGVIDAYFRVREKIIALCDEYNAAEKIKTK
ncbi:MAG: HD-GYP domain-containing protein [Planctomycetaceae bacterium]